MKRTICMVLCVLLCIGLFGCGKAEQTPVTTQPEPLPPLQVGYGRVDISPDPGIPLQGYSNSSNRLCNEVTEPLYATCIAFTDQTGNTVLLYHLDLTTTKEKVFDPIREEIAENTGVPFEQILLASTHTHSAPDLDNLLAKSYTKQLNEWLLKAAQLAMADRMDASVSVSEAYPEDLNWVRYYNYSDGTWGSGTLPPGAKRESHIRDADNQLQMIRFVREGAKDVFLVNWQGHPHRDGGDDKLNATSDMVGAMRKELEMRDEDALFAYFSGASGNVNNHSYIKGVTTTADYYEHGKALVDYMVAAKFSPVESAPIQLLYETESLTSKSDHTKTLEFPLCVFSLGDIAFVMAPYEMFDTSGQYIKSHSDFKMTFVVTYANAHRGYLPTLDAFEADSSYEVRITKVIKGSAEEMELKFTEMLDQIYQQGNP